MFPLCTEKQRVDSRFRICEAFMQQTLGHGDFHPEPRECPVWEFWEDTVCRFAVFFEFYMLFLFGDTFVRKTTKLLHAVAGGLGFPSVVSQSYNSYI